MTTAPSGAGAAGLAMASLRCVLGPGLLFAVLAAAPASAAPDAAFSFSPHPLDRCKVFLTAETSGSRVVMHTMDAMDEYIVTNGIGLMVNLDPRWAVGGGVDLHWARGLVKAAPAARCRRWFGREQSVETSLGYVLGTQPIEWAGDQTQLVGPILSVRYSPVPEFYVQGGVCRYLEQQGTYLPPDYVLTSQEREHSEIYGGLGLCGAGGVALWVCEAVALAAAIALLSGMD